MIFNQLSRLHFFCFEKQPAAQSIIFVYREASHSKLRISKNIQNVLYRTDIGHKLTITSLNSYFQGHRGTFTPGYNVDILVVVTFSWSRGSLTPVYRPARLFVVSQAYNFGLL